MQLQIRFTWFAVAVFAATSMFAAGGGPVRGVPGDIVVKIQAGASNDDVDNLNHIADADKSERISKVRDGAIWHLHSRSMNTEALANALQRNPKVVYAEPNFIVRAISSPNDPSYGQLWGLKNTGQLISGIAGTPGADISAEAAWNVTTGSASIVVGVVDTGTDYNHPDLAPNMWSNPGGKGDVSCAAGTHGFNAITGTCNPMDDHYHGTHTSGTIGAAGNNALGVTGVNWTVSIMALKFITSDGYGTTADAIKAIDFAVQAKIDGVNVRVLSNSWGGGGFSKALLDEINKANENDILFVASAGNDSVNTDTYPNYPSAYTTPNMIAVAATDNRDALAYFSNYGPTTVHLGAPGVNVLSCYPGSSYTTLSGTSMAAPHVAGVAALVLAKTPSLTTAQVKSAILDNVDPISSLTGKTVTGGRLNAARAVGVPAGPDFVMTIAPATRSVVQGASATYGIGIAPSNGFNGSVDLSITGLPTGATASFSPASATTSSTLTVSTIGTTPLGTSTLSVTGVSGSLHHSTSISLTVTAMPVLVACPTYGSSSAYLYSVGSAANAAAIGDFNRDGNPDLAVAATNANKISILRGGPNGTFTLPVDYPVGSAPLSVAVGDLDGDGISDLVVANSTSNNVSILRGNADGTFQAAVNYAAGTNPFWVAVADFNRDGKLDVAVANNGSSNVSILLGQNGGTLQAAVQYSVASGPFWLDAGDFDGDGRLDIAVAAYNADKVSILLGAGDGTFQPHTDYAAGNSPSAVAIGDFNRDGRADLAVSNYGSNNVSVLIGNGNGTFQPAANYPVGTGPYSLAAGDVNGDGKLDLAVGNNDSGNSSILLGNGDGTFAPATTYGAAAGTSDVLVVDLNHDGKADLVSTGTGTTYVYEQLNTGVCSLNCGTLGGAVGIGVGDTPASVAVSDVNRDGKLDLAVANSGGNTVSVALGNGDGTFGAALPYNAGTAPKFVLAGDWNGDGKPDLALANDGSNNVSIDLGNGDGTFQAPVNYAAGTNPRSIVAADFNRDGVLDLAVGNFGSNDVSIFLGNANGTFQDAVNVTVGTGPVALAAGDFNRDGKADLAAANSGSGNVSIRLGNGDGTFQAATLLTAGSGPSAIEIDDFNRDGKADLAVTNKDSNQLSIFLGNGNGTFQTAVQYATGSGPRGVTAGDFDNDGVLDLAVTIGSTNNVSTFLGSGTGTFAFLENHSAGTNPGSVIAADLNGDAKPDLAVADEGSSSVSTLLNGCPVPDLAVTKSHGGNFVQGSTGNLYTITVTNAGAASTNSPVIVTDVPPAGLTVTAISGSGWTCSVQTLTCNRSDTLTSGGSYPPITVTVNVASNAAATVTNRATVSGGGELNALNSSASDPTTITPVTDLIITKTHSGSFTQGATGKLYTIVVRNAGGLATSGMVTVTDTLPAGLTATDMSGTGWTCDVGSLTCTRSDVLAGGGSYPKIRVTVNVAGNAASGIVNSATVAGGGEVVAANDTATDATVVWSSQTCASFGPIVNYSMPSYSQGLAAGDFNRDGHPDLAVTSLYSNSVSIFLGNANGTFAPAVSYPVGSNPISIAVGDINEDGYADLAVTNSYSNTVSVLLGNGNGTFAPEIHFSSGSANAMALADVTGDGHLDLVLPSSYSNAVLIMSGTGTGSFLPATAYPAGDYPQAVAISDFNGDGNADILVSSGNSGVWILLGTGGGSFGVPVRYTTPSYGSFVSVADLNGDGKPDVVVTNYYASSVSVLLGKGDGTLQAAVSYPTLSSASSVAIDDVNGDGKLDLIVISYSSYNLAILAGNGDGTFQTATNYPLSSNGSRVVVSDFNGDGQADLAFSGAYGQVSVMLGGCPDLTITKTHVGSFTAGGTGNYTLTVRNSGGTSRGLVTVTDALPSGLTATAITGTGWTCAVSTATCTRNDALTGGSSYPAITLTVAVATDAAASVTNTASVSGGADSNNANNSASDPTTIIKTPDLSIRKTHEGTFAAGQTGRSYSIVVTNVGLAPTAGTVTVTDTVPPGLTPTAISGPGWTCNLGSRTCTRSDALNPGESYPTITLTVDVSAAVASEVTNFVSVSGGGLASSHSGSDLTYILTVGSNFAATAISTSQVSLSWTGVPHATSYDVLRSSNHGPFVIVGTPVSTSFVDTSLTPNTTYVYAVRGVDAYAIGPATNPDLATTMLFTDDPIISRTTAVKAVHIMELRDAINAVRAAAGLPVTVFTDPTLTAGNIIKAAHLTELKASLDEARSALGLPAIVYSDTAVIPGAPIRSAHVRDLRSGVK